jgi:uncharacterized NAD-dependent epimerase/dehydratase family protein
MILPQTIYNNTNAICIAHGYVGEILGKTVHGLLMHGEIFNIVALADKNKTGLNTSKICPGVTKKVPIYNSVDDTMVHNPKVAILIGEPSLNNIQELKQCICYGLDIINSSFVFLKDFPELVMLAAKFGVRLIDLRDVKKIWKMPDGSILNIKAKVVLVAGTDCGLGKRTATYELVKEAKRRGIKAAFAATGQTGLMLGCDGGIVMDAIAANYVAGAIEELIVELDKKDFDIIFVEGQASLMHFGCSSVISLLHNSNPHAIVMVHDPNRKQHVAFGESPIFEMCSLQREIEIIENLYLPNSNRYKVVAVPTRGEGSIEKVKQLTSLPVADVRKPEGPAIIMDAIIQHLKKEYNWKTENISYLSKK